MPILFSQLIDPSALAPYELVIYGYTKMLVIELPCGSVFEHVLKS